MRTITAHTSLVPYSIGDNSFTLIGLGHIMQGLGLILSKYGTKYMLMFDFDNVESSNMSASFYNPNDINHSKSYEFNRFLYDQSPLDVDLIYYASYHRRINEDSDLPQTNFYIIGVDSGDDRIEVFKSIKQTIEKNKESEYNQFLIDLRVDFNFYEIYGVPLNSKEAIEEYEINLETIKGAKPDKPCGERHLINTVFDVGSIATRLILSYIREEIPNDNINFIRGDSINRIENWLFKPRSFKREETTPENNDNDTSTTPEIQQS